MKTNLYLPMIGFRVNNDDGNILIYENLIQSGPAYKLIVHESPSWFEIKDKMPSGDMIEIITIEKAEEYKEKVDRFFAPISEAIRPYAQTHPDNLTMDLRRALSYILIAHDYKARIYGGSILKEKYEFSNSLRQLGKRVPEECIKRVEFVETLLNNYRPESIERLSINKDPRIYNDLMDLLDNEEIQLLSEKNALLGTIDIKKDILIREIKEFVTNVVQQKLLTYIVMAPLLTISFLSKTPVQSFIPYLTGFGNELIRNLDLREYAPPIQDHHLFTYGMTDMNGIFSMSSFIYTWFNYSYRWNVEIPKRE